MESALLCREDFSIRAAACCILPESGTDLSVKPHLEFTGSYPHDAGMAEATMENVPSANERDSSPQARLKAGLLELRWLFRVVLSSMDRFYWDNGFSRAASLAYSSLTALCFGILGVFVQTQDSMAQVQQFLFKQFVPGNEFQELLAHIQQFSDNMRALNLFVLATLVVTSLLLLNSIESTLNQVWQVHEVRSITDRLAIFCAIIVLIPFFALSGYYTSAKVEPLFAGFDILTSAYQDVLPFLIDFLAFVALYYLVPKAPVRIVPALFGATAASILFGLAKHWFAVYIVRFGNYDRVYEALALIPIFLFWLYICWTVVLFGAEMTYQAQHLPRSGTLWKRSLMSVGDGAMVIAMQTLVLISRAFKRGEKLPNELEIAEELGCSSVVLKASLVALEQAGIIMRGEGRFMPLLLMRAPDTITVAEVRDAVFKKRSSMLMGGEMGRMYKCFDGEADPSTVSLDDLLQEQTEARS
jgi:YihY family inner membrane protein